MALMIACLHVMVFVIDVIKRLDVDSLAISALSSNVWLIRPASLNHCPNSLGGTSYVKNAGFYVQIEAEYICRSLSPVVED